MVGQLHKWLREHNNLTHQPTKVDKNPWESTHITALLQEILTQHGPNIYYTYTISTPTNIILYESAFTIMHLQTCLSTHHPANASAAATVNCLAHLLWINLNPVACNQNISVTQRNFFWFKLQNLFLLEYHHQVVLHWLGFTREKAKLKFWNISKLW